MATNGFSAPKRYTCPISGKECPAMNKDSIEFCMWSYPSAKTVQNKCKIIGLFEHVSWNLKQLVIAKNGKPKGNYDA